MVVTSSLAATPLTSACLQANDELDELLLGVNTRSVVLNVTSLRQPSVHAYFNGSTRAIDHNLYIHGELRVLACLFSCTFV